MLYLTVYARENGHDVLRKEFLEAVSQALDDGFKVKQEDAYRIACERIGAHIIRHRFDHLHHHLTIGR